MKSFLGLIYFIKKFNLNNEEDSTYKVRYKGMSAILKKERDKIVVITIRGFEKDNFKDRESFEITYYNQKKDYEEIYRTNYKGVTKSCGRLKNNKIDFKPSLYKKLIMPLYTDNSNNEEYIYLDGKTKRWFLKEFKRRESFDIYRIRETGKLVKCGFLRDGKVNLHMDLFGKLNIPRNKFFNSRKDDMVYFENGKYILNTF